MNIYHKRHKSALAALLAVAMLASVFAVGVAPMAASAAPPPPAAAVRATNLLVEYEENPIGIDVEAPRFGWTLESDARGVKQTGFRILVAKSEAALAEGPYVWDSGELGAGSDNTIGVHYAGQALEPTTRYYWKVVSATNVGEAVCDAGAFFETGFFDTTMAAWSGAEWISKPEYTVPAWDDVTSYTVEFDFAMAAGGAGAAFEFAKYYVGDETPIGGAAAVTRSLVWKVSPAPEGKTVFAGYYGSDGQPAGEAVDVSAVVAQPAEGAEPVWHTMRIAVTPAGIVTSLGKAGEQPAPVASYDMAAGSNWALGRFGFKADAGEDAFFDNIKVFDNTATPAAENGDANLVLVEGFDSGASELFPTLATTADASGASCVRVNTAALTGPYAFSAIQGAGVALGGGEGGNNILANDGRTKWCANADASSAWFVMDAGAPIFADSYEIRGANDDMSYASRVLHTWIVQGSNTPDDAASWVTISSPGAQGQGWTSNYQLRSFDFDSAAYSQDSPYRYYRLQILRAGNTAEGAVLGSALMQFSYFGLVVNLDGVASSQMAMFPAKPVGFGNEPLFRKEFALQDKQIESARLYATAKGYYEFSINGQKVGDQYLAPGWSDYFYSIMYQTYDVTGMLNAGGANVIGGMTGKGWFSGPHQMMGGGANAYNMYDDVQSLMGKLVVKYVGDDTPDVIVTDGSWSFDYGPIMYADNYMGEGYDARADRAGWNAVGYDASDWVAPLIVPFGPTDAGINPENPQIVGQLEPQIREVARFTPTNVTPEAYPERITYNLGQNISGFVTITVKGRPGDQITLKHAEVLNTEVAYREPGGSSVRGGDGPVGTIYRANLRDSYTAGPVAVDTYILKGDPNGETFTPRFTFHGFQYVEITANNFDITEPGRFEIVGLEGIAISSDNDMLSSFESSHEMVNKLYSNIIWGMLGNHVGVPTDCPNRDERLGYTGDTEIFSRTATYLQNTFQFYERWLRDLRDYQGSQTGDRAGVVPMLLPNNPRTNNFSTQWGNGWGDAAAIVPWNMYQQYGDPQIIYDSYDSMKAWCDFLYRNTSPETHLRVTSGGTREWVLGDWLAYPSDLPGDYSRLTNTIFTAYSHSLFARMIRAIGDPNGEAATYQARADEIVGGIKAQYLKEDGRLMHTGGSTQEKQTAYAMMIAFGLDPENNERYGERLSELIMANGGRLSTGFAGVASLNPALTKTGNTATAFTLLEQLNYPSWLYPITQGATTAWERWNSYTEDNGYGNQAGMNSFNHYSFGSVGEWLMSGVLGIDRDESSIDTAGYRHSILNPQYGGTMTYAKGSYDSMSGRIESAWSIDIETGAFEYDCTVPANTTATVLLPVKTAADVANVTEGGAPLAQSAGVTVGEYDAEAQRLSIDVVSGSYSFGSTAQVYFTNSIGVTASPADSMPSITAEYTDGTDTRVMTPPTTVSVVRGEGVKLTAEPRNAVDFAFDGWAVDGEYQGAVDGATLNVTRLSENFNASAQFKWVGHDNVLAGTAPARIAVTRPNGENSNDWGKQNLVDGRLTQRDGRNGYTTAILSEYPTGNNIPRVTFDAGEGSAYTFSSLKLYPRTDAVNVNGGVAGFPRDFTVQASNDGQNWTTLATEVDATTPMYTPYVIELDESYTYRYLRLDCTRIGPAASDDGGGANYRMQLAEIGAYDILTAVGAKAAEKTPYGDPVEYVFTSYDMKDVNLINVEFTVDGNLVDVATARLEGIGDFQLFDSLVWTPLADGRVQGKAVIGAMTGKTVTGAADVAKLTLGAKKLGDARIVVTGVKVFGIDIIDGAPESGERGSKIDPAAASTKIWSVYDVNDDGVVGSADLSLAFYYYLSKEGDGNWGEASRADVDGSGDVDMTDLLAIYANYIA